MAIRTYAVMILLAGTIAVPAPAPAEEPAEAAGPAAQPAVALPSRKGFALQAGWGYYELAHVGVSYHTSERAAFELFGGAKLDGDAKAWALGAGFFHALGKPLGTMEWGWDVKGLYWSQSDSDYDWKILTLVFGGYLVKDLDPRFALKLDAGVSYSGALESDRKQNLDFGHPTNWNGSVCLELVYRLGR
jgi:hypothetical protein